MTRAIVTEVPRRLEAVVPDPFIADLAAGREDEPSCGHTPAPSRRPSASRARQALATGLALAGVAGASLWAPAAQAAPIPPPDRTVPPNVGAVFAGPADLVVSRTTNSTVKVYNGGRLAAGPFSVLVSQGRIGECDVNVPAVTKRLAGLAAGGSVTVTIPGSTYDRAVTVDHLNQVAESSELNNSGVVPGATIVC